MWWKRYEPLLEQKAVPAEEVLKDLLAREIVDALRAFPPAEDDVQWADPQLRKRFAGRLSELPRVDVPMVRVLVEILRLDVTHEPEAIDHLLRNDRHKHAFPTPAHDDALQLLWRGLLEHLYARKEELDAGLKTKDLVAILERVKGRFERATQSIH